MGRKDSLRTTNGQFVWSNWTSREFVVLTPTVIGVQLDIANKKKNCPARRPMNDSVPNARNVDEKLQRRWLRWLESGPCHQLYL